jgi:hypothetical protein
VLFDVVCVCLLLHRWIEMSDIVDVSLNDPQFPALKEPQKSKVAASAFTLLYGKAPVKKLFLSAEAPDERDRWVRFFQRRKELIAYGLAHLS